MSSIETSSPKSPKKSRYRRAIVISIAAHFVGAIVLLFWYLPNRASKEAQPVAANSSGDSSSAIKSTAPAPTPPTPPPAPEIPAEQIKASIDSQMEQIEKLPDERKLSELEKNLKRLENVASPESVNDVTTTIAETLGLDDEAYQPKATVADGPIDLSTAQIQDVVRTKDKNGVWKYESVLVDAEGRTTKVPMGQADGKTTYETFQQMKKFPMAEGIYRSVVMPMMQKMIAAAETAKEVAANADATSDGTTEKVTE